MQSKYKVKNRWNILQITAFLFSITIVDTKAKTLATTISRVSHGIMGYQGYHGDTLDKSVKSKKWKLLVLEGFLAPFGMWEFVKPSPPPSLKIPVLRPWPLIIRMRTSRISWWWVRSWLPSGFSSLESQTLSRTGKSSN